MIMGMFSIEVVGNFLNDDKVFKRLDGKSFGSVIMF